MKRLLLGALVGVAVCLAVFGATQVFGSDEPCGVTDKGTELCGDAAAAYCEQMYLPDADRDTRDFCRRVGVTWPPAEYGGG